MKTKLIMLILALLWASQSHAATRSVTSFPVITPVDADYFIFTDTSNSGLFSKATLANTKTALGIAAASTPSFASVTATGAGGLVSGVASTTQGSLILYSNVNNFGVSLNPAATPTENVILKMPAGYPEGANYLWNVDADGTSGWTDPATLGGDDLGSAAASDVVALFNTGTCSGYLKSDGLCDTPSGSMVYPSAGIPLSTGSAWGTSYTLDTDLASVSASDDTIPSAKATKAALDLKPNATGLVATMGALTDLKILDTAEPVNGTPLILDTASYLDTDDNLHIWSIEKIGSLLAGKQASLVSGTNIKSINGVSILGSGDMTISGTGAYVATPPTYSDEACTAGQYALSESYRWDCVESGNWNRTALTDWSNPAQNAPTLSSAVIGTNGTTFTLTGDQSLTIGSGGSGGLDVDCVTAGTGITATYASGSPGSALVYTLGTTVLTGDTCDYDYTQPGNGIEATDDGTDLASVTNGSVTNNSTQTGGGATVVTDSFAGTGALDGNWTAILDNGLARASDVAQNIVGATYAGSVYTGATFSADQYVQAKTNAVVSRLWLRFNPTTGDGYFCDFRTSNVTMYKLVDDTETVIGTVIYTGLPVSGDTVRFEVSGNDFDIKINGVSIATRTDSSITATGAPGLSTWNTTTWFDDFEAGDL